MHVRGKPTMESLEKVERDRRVVGEKGCKWMYMMN